MRSCSTRVATRVATSSPACASTPTTSRDDDFDVEICEEDGSADEFPSTTASDCTALTAPSDFSAGLVFFTHAGLALSANTNYVVVIEQRGTGSVRLKSTTNTGEDSAGLSDWGIKNKFYWKSGSTWMIKSGSNEALRIVVSGYEGVAVDMPPPVASESEPPVWAATLTAEELHFRELTSLSCGILKDRLR